MSEPEDTAVYRWFQVGREITRHISPAPGRVMPKRVWERCLVTPDVGTHLCEAAVSTYFDVLDYAFEFDDDVSEHDREWWYDESLSWDCDGFYMHRSDAFTKEDKPKFEVWHPQHDDTTEGAREWATCNHFI